MKINGVHISLTNSKLGKSIPSVNLPVGCTCRPDAPCYKDCYARKGFFAFPSNKALLAGNLAAWQNSPEEYKLAILAACADCSFFRWHSAGDIPDAAYLEMMVEVALARPNVRFLCFTKKYELVNSYLNAGNFLPANLAVVFSAWQGYLPPNPHDLPVAYVRMKGDTPGNALIPADAHECSGYCGACTATGCSCWHLRRGESVVFDKH